MTGQIIHPGENSHQPYFPRKFTEKVIFDHRYQRHEAPTTRDSHRFAIQLFLTSAYAWYYLRHGIGRHSLSESLQPEAASFAAQPLGLETYGSQVSTERIHSGKPMNILQLPMPWAASFSSATSDQAW